MPVHVDGASGAFVAPFLDPDLVWDFRLPRVASINTSGHKYGLVYPGVGWIVWRDADALPEDLIFWVNYLGDNMPTFALNFSRPGRPGRRRSTTTSCAWASRATAACRGTRATSRRGSPAQIAELGPFELLTQRRRAAGVRLQARATTSTTTRSSTCRTRCASAAGSCRRTRSRRTARTSRRCGSSSSAASRTTSPTCSSPTSSGSSRGWRSSPSRCTTRRRDQLPPLGAWKAAGLRRPPPNRSLTVRQFGCPREQMGLPVVVHPKDPVAHGEIEVAVG